MKKIASIRRSTQALLALVAIAASGSALAAGNAVLAIYQQPETLDPYNTNTTITTAVTKSFYEGLFQFDKDLKIKTCWPRAMRCRKTAWSTPSRCAAA